MKMNVMVPGGFHVGFIYGTMGGFHVGKIYNLEERVKLGLSKVSWSHI